MPTQAEKILSHQKRRNGLLVPILEDYLMKPLNVDDSDDAAVVRNLMLKQKWKDEARKEKKVYSPSSLSSCLRQVYFSRNYKDLDIKRKKSTRMEVNYYFLTGNFTHMKWQYALYKMNKDPEVSHEIFQLWGLEIPVVSKHGDHGGTLDALCFIYGKPYVLDFKGVNVRTFGQACMGEVEMKYKIQISDYAMLVNASKEIKIPKIEDALIIYENKGGPDSKHPIALHEVSVKVKDYLPEIKFRLGRLREHEKDGTIPSPECESVGEIQFQGCPFRGECRAEVKKVQASNSRNTKKHSVSVPKKRRTRKPK